MNSFQDILSQAGQGDKNAQYRIGLMYKNGEGCQADRDKAVYWLNEASKQGVADAGFWLSTLVRDPKNSLLWLEWASKRGSVMALNDLGVAYSQGRNVPKDIDKAISCWTNAFDLGERLHSTYNLYCVYTDNNNKYKNLQLALSYLEYAVAEGHPLALVAMGTHYYEGKGVSENPQKSIQLWEAAWKKGEAQAAYDLKVLYSGEKYPMLCDAGKSRHYLTEAANKGHAGALCDLGWELLYSDNEEERYKGFVYTQKAAEKGNVCAMLNYATCLMGQIQVKKAGCNYPMAKKLIENVMQSSAPYRLAAQYRLAWFYYWGVEVEEDQDKAKQMLRDCAAGGFAISQKAVAFIEKQTLENLDEAYGKYVFAPIPPSSARSTKGIFKRIFGF